jgi:ectoine hydroxylase-related dioxygenase (phytanoyl-CoA dioxygenase family)
MDASSLAYRLTPDERQRFERDGYIVVPEALSEEQVRTLRGHVDRLYAKKLAEGFDPHAYLFFPNFLPEHADFVEVVDNPRILPKVWGILGFNIYLYHAHFAVAPPVKPESRAEAERKAFHQDSGRVNREIECSPRPRLSLKVGYFLQADPKPGNGNLYVVPGSHLSDDPPLSAAPDDDPPGAVAVAGAPGSAVIFDRRLWHAASRNRGETPRKVLFYGYGYRWLRTKDDMTVVHLREQASPIRRQLLGGGLNANGHYSPTDDDIPLKAWLEQHDPEVVARWG